MTKLLLIDLGNGNLNEGFSAVTLQMKNQDMMFTQYKGSLPAQPNLVHLYRGWKLLYDALYQRLNWETRIKILDYTVTNVSQVRFDELCQELKQVFNEWLNSQTFLQALQSMEEGLDFDDEFQVLIETEDRLLRRMPWHSWSFFDKYQDSELALSPQQWTKVVSSKKLSKNVRILAVFGNTRGVDIEEERRLLSALPGAEIIFLEEPSSEELVKELENEDSWSILFFAGHSHSDSGIGWLQISPQQYINFACIESAISKAISNGLQIAIFNSCDGLDIAQQLESFNVPHTIVMREPVIDKVAHAFLDEFLSCFASGVSFPVAVRQARRHLQSLEKYYPCASWLPVICNNPTASIPTWNDLRYYNIIPQNNYLSKSRDRTKLKLNILLFEGNVENHKIARVVFEKHQHKWKTAKTKNETIEALSSDIVDLSLLQVSFQEISSLEIISFIMKRESELGFNIPLIGRSSDGIREDKYQDNSIKDILGRPKNADNLACKIDEYIQVCDIVYILEMLGGDFIFLKDRLSFSAEEFYEKISSLKHFSIIGSYNELKNISKIFAEIYNSIGAFHLDELARLLESIFSLEDPRREDLYIVVSSI